MKSIKKSVSILLAVLILISSLGAGASALTPTSRQTWNDNWATEEKAVSGAVTMFPGASPAQRNIAWYSDVNEGYVKVTDESGKSWEVAAEAKQTAQGDYRLTAVLTDLTDGKYTYKCVDANFTSEEYTFAVETGDAFTALYVTDIHSTYDENKETNIRDTNFHYNKTLETAYLKAESRGNTLDLILSGGDQASGGYRNEYEGLSSPDLMKVIPFAPVIGNHDRKSVDYKYYTFLPNEASHNFKSYIGNDYWVRQGNALFLMLDSCNTSMKDHYKFIEQATKANSDATWIIASFHHDLFGGREPWLDTENTMLRLMWTPVFDKFGVDLCLYGHSHYYSVSNVIYNNKTAQSLAGLSEITNPEGTIYLSSGSINNLAPLLDDEGNVPPVGENAAFTFLQEQRIYNLLDFDGNTLTINSYTVDSDENFYSLTIEKTDKKGGHEYKYTKGILKPLIFFVTRIVNIINNYDMYKRYIDQGYDVSLKEGLIGK